MFVHFVRGGILENAQISLQTDVIASRTLNIICYAIFFVQMVVTKVICKMYEIKRKIILKEFIKRETNMQVHLLLITILHTVL